MFRYSRNSPLMSCGAILALVLMTILASPCLAWETIGDLTDPCSISIDDYLDLTEAWVEKSGTQLKFVMLMRGEVPHTTGSPGDENVYLWFVDADNNPNTGQSPGNAAGSEFNIRAVVSYGEIHGFVDPTGDWPGLWDSAEASIIDDRVEVVVDMPQILSPDLFHFRCGSFQIIGESHYPGNDVTEQSAECWASRYAVCMDPNYLGFGIESNISIYKCDPCDPMNTATGTLVVERHSSNSGGNLPVFDTIEEHDDGETPGTHELFGQTMAICDFLHVRTEAVMDILTYDAGAYGQVDTKAAGYQGFRLLGRDGDTGPVPHGMFLLDLRHGYHVRGIEAENKVDAQSYAQIVINDIDADPMVQVGMWGDGRGGMNDVHTGQRVDAIDLADLGMEFSRRYQIDTFIGNICRTSNPSYATYQAQVAGPSDLVVTFRMVHPKADTNEDRTVDFKDIAMLAATWLTQK